MNRRAAANSAERASSAVAALEAWADRLPTSLGGRAWLVVRVAVAAVCAWLGAVVTLGAVLAVSLHVGRAVCTMAFPRYGAWQQVSLSKCRVCA